VKRGLKLSFLLSASLLVPPPFIATAVDPKCYQDCLESHDCFSPHPVGGAAGCYEICRTLCADDGWGAIAYSWKDRIFGWSYALGDRHTAQQAAMQSCERAHGSGCIVQASYYESCGAVAADADIVGWGTESTKAAARQRALEECAKAGGKHCVVQVAVCSARNGNSTGGPASPPPPPRAIAWGAIAYSTRDMGAGWSQDKNDRASAEQEAMSACTQRGKGCVLQTAFNKACGALAADREVAGWGTSADQREANQKAIAACKQAGGRACALHISFCSF